MKGNFFFIFDSWSRYKCEQEFSRMGLSDHWRICQINIDFGLCDIYPRKFIVPTSVSSINYVITFILQHLYVYY